MLSLLKANDGKMLVTLPVGVGKSYNIDSVVETAIRENWYELVVVLTPTHAVLRERRWIKTPPDDLNIITLKPRPISLCGVDSNRQWSVFERNGMGALGRIRLCKKCKHYPNCYWPDQYGKKLKNAQVIYANQAHLQRDTHFITKIKQWAGATNVLVVIDEANFISSSMERRILHEELKNYRTVIKNLPQSGDNEKLTYLLDLLLSAKENDLYSDQWNFPLLSSKSALEAQQTGSNIFGKNFRFLAYDLHNFTKSTYKSREKEKNGDIRFAVSLAINSDLIVYSGSVDVNYATSRLRMKINAPFEGYRFNHAGTRWYNIASRLGMKIYFKHHANQILDFFASLIVQKLKASQKVVLISKKDFKNFCAHILREKLSGFGHSDLQIITDDYERVDHDDPKVIPIIHYGIIGINDFENYDAAFCLNGFYVNEAIVNSILQDCYSSKNRISIDIGTGGIPLRRWAKVSSKADQYFEVNHLSNSVLFQEEMGVVLQAVGRVRPYTKPREIITFQCSDNPQQDYRQEFFNLEEARTYFGIDTYIARKTKARIDAIQQKKSEGLTQKQTSESTGIPLRTVQRYWTLDNEVATLG